MLSRTLPKRKSPLFSSPLLPPRHSRADLRSSIAAMSYKTKPSTIEEVALVSSPPPENPWRPGLFRNTPWMSLLALLKAFLLAFVLTALLISADGRATETWPGERAPV